MLDFSGEPARNRTQGPRLKSSNEGVLTSARYCNGFPIIPCNIAKLSYSIGSIRSRTFLSIPTGFDTKFTTVVARIKLWGAFLVIVSCRERYQA